MTERPRLLQGRYELDSALGRGGMAEVFRAHDLVLGRDVAVKLMHDTLGDDVAPERFRAEAQLMAGLDHPHLVTVFDAGVDEGQPWLAMELVEGTTLASLLTGGPLEAEQVARIGQSVASALDHVHARGIVHRDVKPANILMTSSGDAKLADFGVARLSGDDAGLTRTGHTVGTAAYLAPEQIQGGSVSGGADVYALGLVLLEALTGRRAYTGSATEAALARLHRGPLIPVSLPRGWPRLLDEMTAADPDTRPIAAEVATRLDGIDRDSVEVPDPTGAVPVTEEFLIPAGAASVGEPTPGATSRRIAVWPVLAATALLAVLLGAGIVARGAGQSDATPPPRSVPSRGSTPAQHATSRPGTASPSPTQAVTSSPPAPVPAIVTNHAPRPSQHHPAGHHPPGPPAQHGNHGHRPHQAKHHKKGPGHPHH